MILEENKEDLSMKKRIAFALVLCFVLSACAVAERVSFKFAVVPTSSAYEYQVGARGSKADNEQRFYVKTEKNGFPDGRDMYYISCDATGRLVSGIVVNSGNAEYGTMATAGGDYMLAYRTSKRTGDSDTLCCIVEGRWNP